MFKEQLNSLLSKLRNELAKAFSSDDYKEKRNEMIEASQTEQQAVFEQAKNQAREQGFLLQITPEGPTLLPLVDGKPLTPAEFVALDEAAQKAIEDKRNNIRKVLQSAFEKIQELIKNATEKLINMDRAVADYTAVSYTHLTLPTN